MECNLPIKIGSYPTAPRECAIVGMSDAKESLLAQQFCLKGCFPVNNDILAGKQIGEGVYTLSNETPLLANLSKFGVLTILFP